MMMRKWLTHSNRIRPQKIIVPMAFTFANACLGMISILQALNGDYLVAAYCIVAAAIMDMMDGRIARALKVQSLIGLQLDSLCDAISFCLAPAVLLYSWLVHDIGWFVVPVLAVYLCCGLYRLAKFNVTAQDQKYYFIGLPTPAAAFILTALVFYQEWIELNYGRALFHKIGLMALVIAIAYLMVSRIQFPAFKSKGHTNALFVRVFFMSGFVFAVGIFFFHWPIFLSLVAWYLIVGILFTLCTYISARRALKRIR
jgi:CDP-diacylglycerol--serine O-phosphatidyltransferase